MGKIELHWSAQTLLCNVRKAVRIVYSFSAFYHVYDPYRQYIVSSNIRDTRKHDT